ncbi:ATP-binding protein [Comamonas sp. MYb396]|uniref:ATP-binding protein n=1 Tax=Comamonas sp. MYb396 TaxID=2745302 RepID=UPI0030A07BA5
MPIDLPSHSRTPIAALVSCYLPTLNEGLDDIEKLLILKKQLESPSLLRKIDFANCEALGPTAISVLAGIIRDLESRGRPVIIDWKSLNSKLQNEFNQNGFSHFFKRSSSRITKHHIPFREDIPRAYNADAIFNHLFDEFLNKNWINFSEELKSKIAGTIWEIFTNSFEHSNSQVGVFSCGQHYMKKNEVILSVVDFGVGIPDKVRRHFSTADDRYTQLNDSNCLQWAFKPGNSTDRSVPRGLGLDLLREFVYINKGALELRSGAGYVKADDKGLHYDECASFFPGTCVQLKMMCDGRYYRFKSENDTPS